MLIKKNHSKRLSQELKRNEFRVAIFGSARINKNDKTYRQVYSLAKEIGKNGIDLVTGGGPGLMEAANAGHEAGDANNIADSIGLIIELPWTAPNNAYLEMQKRFKRFSKRLDNFMALSSAVVIVPGGIGTCLEFFYTWQLIQVKHIHPIPIILTGKMWEKLIEWVRKYPLKRGLISPHDMKHVHIAKNNKEAIKLIISTYRIFKKEGKNFYKNIKKYSFEP
ncbi:MAG: LOG family protein [Candidatus Peregrinibacteria bacterium]